MKREEAMDLIRHCVVEGQIVIGPHAKRAMREEDFAISADDILHVLKHGVIYSEPEQDLKTGDWKYRAEGNVVSGKRLGVVFCFRAVDTGFVITIFELKR